MKQRINYIDALRGFAIFCVVLLHFSAWALDIRVNITIIELLESLFIPLFFFISGFIGYRKKVEANEMPNLLWNKTKTLLIPTIVFFLLSAWHFGFSPLGWLQPGTKAGYWFAYVLFQLFVIYYIIKILLTITIIGKKGELLIFPILLIALFTGLYFIQETSIGDFLSINMVIYSGFVYFFSGLLAGRYKSQFLALQTNKYYLWGLAAFTIIEWNILPIHWSIHNMCTTLLVFSLFYNNREWFNGQKKINKMLSYWGRNSLAIYFLHYWLLFDLPSSISEWINWIDTQHCFVPGGSTDFAFLLVSFPMVMIICQTCCFIKRLSSFIPHASLVLFGDKGNG